MSKRTFPLGEDAEKPVRVLIVDDNEPWRSWVCSELAKQQLLQVVGEASDGLEAVKKAHELKPDLILMDIGLPNANGIAAARQIAKSVPDTRIIFVTNEEDPDVARRVLNGGAKGYVLKRAAKTDLMAAIIAVLQGQRFVSKLQA